MSILSASSRGHPCFLEGRLFIERSVPPALRFYWISIRYFAFHEQTLSSLIAKPYSLENRQTAATLPCMDAYCAILACCLLATLMYALLKDLEDVPTLCTSLFALRMLSGLMVAHRGPFCCGNVFTGLNHCCRSWDIANTWNSHKFLPDMAKWQKKILRVVVSLQKEMYKSGKQIHTPCLAHRAFSTEYRTPCLLA